VSIPLQHTTMTVSTPRVLDTICLAVECNARAATAVTLHKHSRRVLSKPYQQHVQISPTSHFRNPQHGLTRLCNSRQKTMAKSYKKIKYLLSNAGITVNSAPSNVFHSYTKQQNNAKPVLKILRSMCDLSSNSQIYTAKLKLQFSVTGPSSITPSRATHGI
jgi:hypothetical protein